MEGTSYTDYEADETKYKEIFTYSVVQCVGGIAYENVINLEVTPPTSTRKLLAATTVSNLRRRQLASSAADSIYLQYTIKINQPGFTFESVSLALEVT